MAKVMASAARSAARGVFGANHATSLDRSR